MRAGTTAGPTQEDSRPAEGWTGGTAQPCRWVPVLQTPGGAHACTHTHAPEHKMAHLKARRLAGQRKGAGAIVVRVGFWGLRGWGTRWAEKGGPSRGDPSTSLTVSGRVPGRGLARGEGASGDRTGGRRQKRGRPASPGLLELPSRAPVQAWPLRSHVPGASTAHRKSWPVAAALQARLREQPHPGTCCKQSLGTHPDLHNQKLLLQMVGPRGLFFFLLFLTEVLPGTRTCLAV